VTDADLRAALAALAALDPPVRDTFRRVLIRDQTDRDAIAHELLRYRDEELNRLADVRGIAQEVAAIRAEALPSFELMDAFLPPEEREEDARDLEESGDGPSDEFVYMFNHPQQFPWFVYDVARDVFIRDSDEPREGPEVSGYPRPRRRERFAARWNNVNV